MNYENEDESQAARLVREKLKAADRGVEPTALVTLAKLAPVNAFVAAVPWLFGLLFLLAGWAAAVLLTAFAGYLVLTALTAGISSDGRTLSALFFLLGSFGASLILCVVMSSLTSILRSILRMWLKLNFDFLLGSEEGERKK
jgi:uncharacterized membrane protein